MLGRFLREILLQYDDKNHFNISLGENILICIKDGHRSRVLEFLNILIYNINFW